VGTVTIGGKPESCRSFKRKLDDDALNHHADFPTSS
jgi:hypothetical protein